MMTNTAFPLMKRFILVLSLFVTAFSVVAIRLVVIQGFQGSEWLKRAQGEHERRLPLEPERGAIYDRNGRIFAVNVDVPSAYATPTSIRNPFLASKSLAPIIKADRVSLTRKLDRGRHFVWLDRKMDPKRAETIKEKKIEGVGFVMESKRFYPKRALFGHALGFAGLDNRGLEGVELKYDALLRGETGWWVVQRDAHGNAVFPKGFNYIAPARGRDLYLTVDEVIQYISERALDRAVASTRAKGGTVIVMDPWNGEILAMATRPLFNPNTVGTHTPSEWRNRAITDAYEPGSMFKIVTASAALEEKIVHPDEMIDCEQGRYEVTGTVLHDHIPVGVVPFRQVIARSSNIGMAKVAARLGPERFKSYIRAFGFGEPLGVDLFGEARGLVRGGKPWSKRSVASIAMGQEIGVTPLQMATATSAVANGGWLVVPHLVRLVKEGNTGDTGQNEKETAKQVRRRVISEATAKEMVGILKEVVTQSGTGGRAAVPGFPVAGKTGTAQKIDPKTGHYSRTDVISSFVGFAPADDPVVTILVMVDEPEGEGWGGDVAAPVFSTIASEILYYMKKVPADLDNANGPTDHLQMEAKVF